MVSEKEKKILEFLERGILLSPELEGELDSLASPPTETPADLLLFDRESRGLLDEGVDWRAFDAAKALAEKDGTSSQYARIVEHAKRHELREKPGVKVLRSYTKKSKKGSYEDFVSHFNRRFRVLTSILRQRQELASATAIGRLPQRGERARVSVIGMVKKKSTTKSNNTIITIEDQTGEVVVLIRADRQEVAAIGRDIVLDEVLGVSGTLGDRILFADELFLPEVPLTHELKKGLEEEYVAVIGDPQIGSKEFLSKDFAKLLAWFNCQLGNEEQRRVAAKVKYLVVAGDLVEGVGVYPGQEEDLTIKDIKEQYVAFTRYLQQIPKHIQILVIPGNHDAGRMAEPQPPIYRDFAPDLYEMENVTMLSNPCLVNIGAKPGFTGFDMLLYHGYSLIYYSDNVPSIRERGGQKRAELIMKFLLQRRHLAPTHGSNLYMPDPEEDPLTIDRVPDIFITGHIHRVASATYRGVTLLNASTWGDITADQERRGLEPQPARLPLINLQTRDVKVINFYSGKGKGFLAPGETLEQSAQLNEGAS